MKCAIHGEEIFCKKKLNVMCNLTLKDIIQKVKIKLQHIKVINFYYFT